MKGNAKALAAGLRSRGHQVATDGTDNHLLLWDLRPKGITGSKVEKLLEACSISANKVGLRFPPCVWARTRVHLLYVYL